MKSHAMLDAIIEDIGSKITTATTLGGITQVVYNEEHPAIPANEGALPIAYILPIVEGGGVWKFSPMPGLDAEFPITIIAYYDGVTQTGSLKQLVEYAMTFLDILYNGGQYSSIGQYTSAEVDFGHWESVDKLVHMWIVKLHVKVLYTND